MLTKIQKIKKIKTKAYFNRKKKKIFRHIGTNLYPFGLAWTGLEPFGACWSQSEPVGASWSQLEPSGAILTNFDQF